MPEIAAAPPAPPASAAPAKAPEPKGPEAKEQPKADSKTPVQSQAPANDKNAKSNEPEAKVDKKGEAKKPEEAKAPEASAKTFKLVVKGKEVQVPEDQYHRLAQKGLAADVTLQQFAEFQKSQAALIGALKDPARLWKVLERLGHDPLKVASELVYDRGVRREKMSEAEREAEDLRQKMAERDERDKRIQEELATKMEQAQVNHWKKAFSQDIISAMDSTPELPKTAETVSRLAFHMRQALRNREEGDETPIRASDFVPKVLEEFRELTRAFLKNRPGKDMLDLLGDDVRTNLRKAELEAIGATSTPAAQQNGQPSPDSQTSKRKLSRDEWDELVRKRAGM